MPLIYVGQYNNIKPGLPQFDMANFQIKTGETGMVHFMGDAFYGTDYTQNVANTGRVYKAADASVGFTQQNATILPMYAYAAMTRNNTSGRLMQIATNDLNSNSSTFYYSDDDGYSWATRSLGFNYQWRSIASDNAGTVIAVATSSNGSVSYHTIKSLDDGYTWTDITSKALGGDFITYIPRLNLWISTINGAAFRYSLDGGTTWTLGTNLGAGNNSTIRIIDTGDLLVMGCKTISNFIKTSTDGINWTTVSTPTAPATPNQKFLQDFAYCNGLWVFTFGDPTIYTSPDLASWSQGILPIVSGNIRQSATYAAFGNNQLVLSTLLNTRYAFYQF